MYKLVFVLITLCNKKKYNLVTATIRKYLKTKQHIYYIIKMKKRTTVY